MKRAENESPDREEKPLLNIRMLEQVPSAQSATNGFCFIIAFQLCEPDESFLEKDVFNCVRQDVPRNFPKTRSIIFSRACYRASRNYPWN